MTSTQINPTTGHNIFPRSDGHRFTPGEAVLFGSAERGVTARVHKEEGDHVFLLVDNSPKVSQCWPDSVTLPYGDQSLVGHDVVLRSSKLAKVVAVFGPRVMVEMEGSWTSFDMLLDQRSIGAVL